MPSNSWWCDSTVVKNKQNPPLSDHIPVCFARVLSKEKGLDRHGTCVNTGNQGWGRWGAVSFSFLHLSMVPLCFNQHSSYFLISNNNQPAMNNWNSKWKTILLISAPPKKNPEIFSYTSNKICIRCTQGTLPNSDERNHRIKQRANPCSQSGTLSIVKISVLPDLTYRFSTIPMKIPTSYFVNIKKRILKFIQRGKKFRIANTILRKNKIRVLTLPEFKA